MATNNIIRYSVYCQKIMYNSFHKTIKSADEILLSYGCKSSDEALSEKRLNHLQSISFPYPLIAFHKIFLSLRYYL